MTKVETCYPIILLPCEINICLYNIKLYNIKHKKLNKCKNEMNPLCTFFKLKKCKQ